MSVAVCAKVKAIPPVDEDVIFVSLVAVVTSPLKPAPPLTAKDVKGVPYPAKFTIAVPATLIAVPLKLPKVSVEVVPAVVIFRVLITLKASLNVLTTVDEPAKLVTFNASVPAAVVAPLFV